MIGTRMLTQKRILELRKEARLQGEGGTMTCSGGEMLELLAVYDQHIKLQRRLASAAKQKGQE